jgi:hypothetical protein
MNMNKRVLSSCIALSLSALLVSSPLSAASKCKGLSEKTCDKSDSCAWVGEFKRKDGAKVKAYCRAKPKKSSLSATAKKNTTKKSAKTKIEDKKKVSKQKANTATSKTSKKKSDVKKVIKTADKKKSS